MKKFSFFSFIPGTLLLVSVLVMTAFTACTDDDDTVSIPVGTLATDDDADYDFSTVYKGQTLYFYFDDENAGECSVTYTPGSYDEEKDYFYSAYSGDIEIPSAVSLNGTNYRVTAIGDYSFCNSEITSITLPEGITTIGEYVFHYSNITSITIPESVTAIDEGAFEHCENLKTVSLPEGLTIIEDYTFSSCVSLQSIEIPSTVTEIGIHAFFDCDNLTSVHIPETVEDIGSMAFSGCNSLQEITVDSENQNYSAEDGILYNKEKTTLVVYPAGKTDETFTIPSTVNNIKRYAFCGCHNLKTVIIPSSWTTIPNGAFASCYGLTYIEIPAGVTEIGGSAFTNCYTLTSVTLPNTLKEIGEDAFARCTSLTEIDIPANVTTIGYRAFGHCKNLKSVTSRITEPFEISDDVFECNVNYGDGTSADQVYKNATLYVPVGTVDTYKATAGWNKFKTIREIGE